MTSPESAEYCCIAGANGPLTQAEAEAAAARPHADADACSRSSCICVAADPAVGGLTPACVAAWT